MILKSITNKATASHRKINVLLSVIKLLCHRLRNLIKIFCKKKMYFAEKKNILRSSKVENKEKFPPKPKTYQWRWPRKRWKSRKLVISTTLESTFSACLSTTLLRSGIFEYCYFDQVDGSAHRTRTSDYWINKIVPDPLSHLKVKFLVSI